MIPDTSVGVHPRSRDDLVTVCFALVFFRKDSHLPKVLYLKLPRFDDVTFLEESFLREHHPHGPSRSYRSCHLRFSDSSDW